MPITVPDTYTYLDYAATAPLCEEAAAAMRPYLEPGSANLRLGMNANSLHAPGRAAFEALELARREIARDLGAARPNEVIFTSGATEADNMALAGIARGVVRARQKKDKGFTGRIITTAIEHEAVLEPARMLAREGFEVVYLKPDRQGFITPEALEAALAETDSDAKGAEGVESPAKGAEGAEGVESPAKGAKDAEGVESPAKGAEGAEGPAANRAGAAGPAAGAPHTVLVSVQAANSEIGSVQPIAELAAIAHAHGALFHTDATQALGKMPFDVRALGVDAASFSAHKIAGPKGVGALYLKARTPFAPLILGGGQEEGRRSTTQNVCGIAGFAAACTAAVGRVEEESARERDLRDYLYARLADSPGVRPTVAVEAGSESFLANIVHVLVKGFESETLVLRLDRAGFGVSGGSACASHSLEPSHVLRALGISADDAYSALRISIGRATTREDLDRFCCALRSIT